MIPYNEPPVLRIGDLEFNLFGALVAIGVILGAAYTRRRGREWDIPDRDLTGLVWWTLLFGFPLSFALNVLFYKIDAIQEQGLTALIDPSRGMSSFGGFLGAMLGGSIYVKKVLRKKLMPFADIALQGLCLGWIFGRLGCTLVHDHIGVHTDFFLGTRYPDGTRHNLGMYEFLYTVLIMFPSIVIIRKRFAPRPGWYSVILALEYAPVRFGLDFLRAEDERYGGLTFAQYCCIACFVWGLWYWLTRLRGSSG